MLFICILALLIIRELFIIVQTPALHPERKMAIFNSMILALFLVSSLCGVRILMLHDAQFTKLFFQYPNSRYAPEREILSKTSDWIYTTKDGADTVVSFYSRESKKQGFQTTLDTSGTNRLFLFEKNNRKMFLTVISENDNTVLYFSQTGEVKTAP